jgi:uncharacterized phage-like protein YoqJ
MANIKDLTTVSLEELTAQWREANKAKIEPLKKEVVKLYKELTDKILIIEGLDDLYVSPLARKRWDYSVTAFIGDSASKTEAEIVTALKDDFADIQNLLTAEYAKTKAKFKKDDKGNVSIIKQTRAAKNN